MREGLGTGVAGSSPLTRGKPADRRAWALRIGLIPAHAGKTRAGSRNPVMETAHPRSRGENMACGASAHRTRGSSPLTRGKRRAHGPLHGPAGLIPAHAGKTDVQVGVYQIERAHPRSRGENVSSDTEKSVCPGSSPLTRGKH